VQFGSIWSTCARAMEQLVLARLLWGRHGQKVMTTVESGNSLEPSTPYRFPWVEDVLTVHCDRVVTSGGGWLCTRISSAQREFGRCQQQPGPLRTTRSWTIWTHALAKNASEYSWPVGSGTDCLRKWRSRRIRIGGPVTCYSCCGVPRGRSASFCRGGWGPSSVDDDCRDAAAYYQHHEENGDRLDAPDIGGVSSRRNSRL
jgi:hypothetical protein